MTAPPPRPLRVCVIADAVAPVPPRGYGGTERIVALLCEGLARRGHRVALMAAEGSRRDWGRLVVHVRADNRSWLSRAYRKLLFQPLSLWAAAGADVIHNFGRVDYLTGLLATSTPMAATFQNPLVPEDIAWLVRRRPAGLILTAISDRQRAGLDRAGRWRTVYNAADPERFPFRADPDRPAYLAFLGRLTANKGVDTAVRVARAAGMPLRIAGNIPDEPGAAELFEREVRPHLGAGVEWVGELDDAAKKPFLAGAAALLFPIRWEEPFGIVMAEALACGTPVVALRRGAVPEVVDHGVTGFVCDDEAGLTAAVGRLGGLDRAACRRAAETRFSADAMVEGYLSVYRELLAG